jgi:chaperonin GroEL
VTGPQNRTPIPRGRTIAKEQAAPPPNIDISKQSPGIRFTPEALFLLKKGVDSIANAVRPTLGPLPRNVAVDPVYSGPGGKPPELLDDGATIARRMVEMPDAYVNAGAMLLRHILWNVHERVGDGSTTAAVLMQAMVREGVRLTAAGWNPMMMRKGIEIGLERCVSTLREMARPVETEADVAGLALAASADPDLAKRMGEIFDTLGADGHVVVQQAYRPGVSHEYIEGAYWGSGWITPHFANNDLQNSCTLTDPYVLVARGRIEKWDDIAPLIEAAAQESASLFIIALDVADTALNILLTNKEKVPCAAVKAPSYGDLMEDQLEDIAVLTGTRVILNHMNESVAKLTLADLGRVRSVTVNKDYFGIIGGMGDAKLLRERIALVRNQLRATEAHDSEKLSQRRERLAKLIGGIAIVYVAAATESESKELRERVERTVNTVKQAQMAGIVPGAGAAYIACARALRSLKLPPEQMVGVDVLAKALDEPLRTIAHNAGADASPVVARAHEQRAGWGYNALTDTFEDLWAAGIVDPLPVVQTALESAVSGAIMTLTTSVTIHRKNPPTSTEP